MTALNSAVPPATVPCCQAFGPTAIGISDMMLTGELRPRTLGRQAVSQPGRLKSFELRRREERFEQFWFAGNSLKESAKLAGLTGGAALDHLDRLGVRLPSRTQVAA